MFHNEFYPTNEETLLLMGLDPQGKTILDPSAGSGNILDYALRFGAKKTYAIEITSELRSIVKSKHELIGKDFFDTKSEDISFVNAIYMNPPFSNADKHILHAWEIAPDGCEIVAICNSNTIENDHSRTRRQLNSAIRDYGNVQHIGSTFSEAERKTDVSIAVIKLFKPQSSSNFNFEGFFIEEDEVEQQFQGEGIQRYDEVRALVNRYVGSIKNFDSMFNELDNLNRITSQLGMSKMELELSRNERILDRDTFAKTLQKKSWEHIFNKMNLSKYVTSGVMKDINKFVEEQTKYPFTMRNIYKMFEIIVGTREQTFNRALEEAIDNITRHTHENRYNVEGWKTNSGYMLNKKFIIENVVDYSWSSELRVKYDGYSINRLDDLIKVVCSLTGNDYNKLLSKTSEENKATYYTGNPYNLNSLYKPIQPNNWYDYGFFEVKFFKKGTAHLKFKDEKVWYMVNQAYGKIKGFTLKETVK